MKDISISDALRYLVIGVEPLIIVYFFGDKKLVIKLITDFGAVGLPLFAFALGAIFYSIYKVFLHTWIIRPTHYWHKDSYRKYILNNYKNDDGRELNQLDAERFWFYLSTFKFKDRILYLDNQSSMGHLVYQTGIMLIISPFFLTISDDKSYVHLFFIFTGTIILLLGWFYAGFIEKYIYRLIITLSNEEIKLKNRSEKTGKNELDKCAINFGFKPKDI